MNDIDTKNIIIPDVVEFPKRLSFKKAEVDAEIAKLMETYNIQKDKSVSVESHVFRNVAGVIGMIMERLTVDELKNYLEYIVREIISTLKIDATSEQYYQLVKQYKKLLDEQLFQKEFANYSLEFIDYFEKKTSKRMDNTHLILKFIETVLKPKVIEILESKKEDSSDKAERLVAYTANLFDHINFRQFITPGETDYAKAQLREYSDEINSGIIHA